VVFSLSDYVQPPLLILLGSVGAGACNAGLLAVGGLGGALSLRFLVRAPPDRTLLGATTRTPDSKSDSRETTSGCSHRHWRWPSRVLHAHHH